MSMAQDSFVDDEQDAMMSEINMTPMVDVMLVLLVIFLVTLPVINHAVKINLPHASSQVANTKPPHVDVAIAADGAIQWDGKLLDPAQLSTQISQAAHATPVPELHLYADRKVAYEKVADLMSAAQAGGLTKIGFVTAPTDRHSP